MSSGSNSSSDDEDMSRFRSVAVSGESVTAAATAAATAASLPHKNVRGKSRAQSAPGNEAATFSIVENQLYDALASRLADDSGCEAGSLDDGGKDSGRGDVECRGGAGGNSAAISPEDADQIGDQHAPFQIFGAAPPGQPVTFAAIACPEQASVAHDTASDAAILTAQRPLTRRERVHAMKKESRRQRKALEKAGKAKVVAAKAAQAAKRRGIPKLPAPPPLPLDSEARALRAADLGGAHLESAPKPNDHYAGVVTKPAVADVDSSRPQSLAEAAERGIEVTDQERKVFKRRWRIAKNERRKAKNAIGRAARQVKKAAHHEVKYKIKKEKQARKDRFAQRELNAAAGDPSDSLALPLSHPRRPMQGHDSAGAPDSSVSTAKASAPKQTKGAVQRKEVPKTARKKISVKRGRFSTQRCVKRNKALKRNEVPKA